MAENIPLITIIIVTFNAEKCLEKSLKSIKDLNYANIELIIIDGCSIDNTCSIIKEYLGLVDYWLSEPDDGIYDAMNKGIKMAHGEWIYFLGAGDQICFDGFSFISQQKLSPNVIFYGNVQCFPSGKIVAGRFSKRKITLRNIPHQAILYPKKIFDDYEYENKYKILADYELNLRLFGDTRFTFFYIDQVISIFQQGGISALSKDQLFWDDKLLILKNNLGTFYACFFYLHEKLRLLYRKIIPFR